MKQLIFVFLLHICFSLQQESPTSSLIYLNCTSVSRGHIKCNGTEYVNEELSIDVFNTLPFWVDLGVSCALILTAGLMSGLTLGLMSLSLINLKIVRKSGNKRQRSNAKKIIPLVKRHHLLLVTLLLTNAAANEALPIFLSHLVSEVYAIIISVTAVLFFGEIIPQAFCTQYGLSIGASLHWLVWILIGISSPISYPLSKILDCILGKDEAGFFRRAEIKELVSIHLQQDVNGPENFGEEHPEHKGGDLTHNEVQIIQGALAMVDKKVEDRLTLIENVFMLPYDTKFDYETLKLLCETGKSRIPIYKDHKDFIMGMILTKSLIMVDPQEEIPLHKIKLYRLPTVNKTMPLYDLLETFKKGRSHMAIVLDVDNYTPLGIITLEDVIEELLQEDIVDEGDLQILEKERRMKLLQRVSMAYIPKMASRPDIHKFSRKHTSEPMFNMGNRNLPLDDSKVVVN